MKKDIHANILTLQSSLGDVIQQLNKGIYGVVFIVDEDERVIGMFTDGDVRRAIMGGASLSSDACNYMKKDFIYENVGKDRDTYIKRLTENIRHLPILDKDGRLVDFISWAEIWKIPIMEPSLGGNELKYVSNCITTNWISSQGRYVRDFEKKFAEYHNIDYALTTTSGTTALHLALVALGIGPGDEVIVPDITFAASANTVVHAGAEPVFVEVSIDHWTISPGAVEKAITKKTKAIMPVHLYGHPCDMGPILEIAKRYNLLVVEDCAESLGARYNGRLTGIFGQVGCFSFFSNKVITTGEGGMVITNDRAVFEKMELLRDHGMSKNKKYWHEAIGYNYRMTNLQAAVGLAQLEQIDKFLENRHRIADCYSYYLNDIEGITLPPNMEWAENIYWLYTILIDERLLGLTRDALIKALVKEGVETRPVFYPLHSQPVYQKCKGDFPNAEFISRCGISLPSSNQLAHSDIQRVCEKLKKIIQNRKALHNII